MLREAGFSADATAKARGVVESFQQFFAAHKDAIVALQILYSRPYGQQRLSFAQVRELAARLEQPPLSLTTEALWRAYVQLEQDRVRGVGGQRVLADLVALVRHAVEPGGELAPYPEHVRARYEQWLERQQANGRVFTPEQRWWLDRIAEQIGVNLSVAPEDFDYGEFFKRGGRLGALRALGTDWTKLLDELNSELTA